MNIYLIIETIKYAIEVGENAAQIVDLLKQYVDCMQHVEHISGINRKMALVRDILSQEEENDDLKYTRVLSHLEAVYVDLAGMADSKLVGSQKIRHKMDQVSIQMAIIHKLLGNPVDTIYKYAIDRTALSKPIANHLCWSDMDTYNRKYFLISREQLKWLITAEKYNEFIGKYDSCIYKMGEAGKSLNEPEDGCFGGSHYGD